MASEEQGYYDGSQKLLWLSIITGLTIDQVNFVVSQLVALVMSVFLRTQLNPSHTKPSSRHVFSTSVGLILVYFCHGGQMIHILALPLVCYFVMCQFSPQIFQRIILVIALTYLSTVHIMRQVYNYGSYVLDITGPMMVITQKVTSLAFSLHDGLARDESALTTEQKKYAVKSIPSPLEYFSYIFHFQALMCGPLTFYVDYIQFVEGNNYIGCEKLQGLEGLNAAGEFKPIHEPSPNSAVLKKVATSFVCALLLLNITPLYPIQRIKDEDFVLFTSLNQKMMYLILATSIVRFKYYHAWLLADAVCNASGMGFNGYSKDGTPQWDMHSNVDIVKFELGLNMRDCLQSWNKSTMVWLRRIAYERAPGQKTLLTYSLSALWHGFYPGYYLTFLSGAVFTVSGRSCRRSVRPYFQTSSRLALLYDALSFLVTKAVMGYITFPFILLEFWSSLYLYWHMYFFLHVIGLLAIFVLPGVLSTRRLSSNVTKPKEAPSVTKAVTDGLGTGGKVLAKVQ